jgi:hypothetical protein
MDLQKLADRASRAPLATCITQNSVPEQGFTICSALEAQEGGLQETRKALPARSKHTKTINITLSDAVRG